MHCKTWLVPAAAAAVLLVSAAGRATGAGLPFQDPALPVEQRVADLLARLTTDEKIHQLNNDSAAVPRLGLAPYNVWNEALHGVARNGVATMFPQAIGLAATFDAPRLREVGQVIAREARAKHERLPAGAGSGLYEGLTFFSPNINIFRDPRWGRGQETYGEDPILTGRMAVAFIRGLQGDDPQHPLAGATAKHYAVHSGPELLRHGFDARPGAHDLEDTYLPAFRAAVVEGKVASVMCVYNAIDGVPGCANEALLVKRLRGDWGFGGFVVSDCNAVSDMYTGHHYFADEAAAAAGALRAGVDNECTVRTGVHEQDYAKYADALRAGLIAESDIDRAVARVLRERIALGLLDPRGAAAPAGAFDTPADRALALQVARESLVLLKNDGLLPLRKPPARIAVVGPLATSQRALEGNYNGAPSRVTDVLAGIRARFAGSEVRYEPGTADFLRAEVPVPTGVLATASGEPGLELEYLAAPGVEARAPRTVPGVLLDNRSDAGIRTARWTGWLVPDATGDYRLAAHGAANRVWLDGRLVVDTVSTGTESRPGFGDVHLEQGRRYALRVENQPSLVRGVRLAWFRKQPDALARAVAAARAADLVIAVVGLTADLEGEESALDIPGFKGGDRTSLDLPAPEQQLLEAVHAEGKPLAVVLLSGSGLAVNWAQAHAGAILQAWYPGEEGGQAVAEVLAGDYNPGGRLPVTFYRGVEQLPDFADYSMQGRTYRYFSGQPLYGFGYGLSYTRFRYSPLSLSTRTLSAGQPLEVEVHVRNVGKVAGDEVVQAYLRVEGAAGAPRHALCAFERVGLRPGEVRTVRFTLDARALSHVDESGRRLVTPGRYLLHVGGGQPGGGLPGSDLAFQVRGEITLAP